MSKRSDDRVYFNTTHGVLWAVGSKLAFNYFGTARLSEKRCVVMADILQNKKRGCVYEPNDTQIEIFKLPDRVELCLFTVNGSRQMTTNVGLPHIEAIALAEYLRGL